MDLLLHFLDMMLHLDRYLTELVTDYGPWVYGILFLIIFCETGLVVTPFLPGDSLLFVAGMLAGAGLLDPTWLMLLLILAAILGDSVNYSIGRWVGPAVFRKEEGRFFKKKHLEHTQRFYERHGGKTIIIARFVPILRTFAPFVAGIGNMVYRRFLAYNVAGAILWVVSLVTAGYFLGDLPVIKDNLTAVIFGIIFLSLLPGLIEYWRHRRAGG